MENLKVGDIVKATQKFSVGDSVTVVDINRMYILDSDPPKEGAPARVVGLSKKAILMYSLRLKVGMKDMMVMNMLAIVLKVVIVVGGLSLPTLC